MAPRRSAAARRSPETALLSEEGLTLLAARFRALGDARRLRVLNALLEGERSVGALVLSTGLEQPTVSRHLAVLRREGMVARRSEGNRAFYRIDDPTVVRLCQVACGGLAEQLADDLEALPDERFWRGSGI